MTPPAGETRPRRTGVSRRIPDIRVQGFQDLMREMVEEILLVASPYDCFTLQQDGTLNERLLDEFLDLGFRHIPGLTHVSTGSEALARLRDERRCNLVVTAPHVGDMDAVALARRIRELRGEIPIILLAFDNRELNEFTAKSDLSAIDRVFLWQGDVRILLAIVKHVEDRLNVARDSGDFGVPLILLVEDSVRYYSSFLPMIYTELVKHSHELISEGVNLAHKILRMRARPKLLLATSFEEALRDFEAYHDSMLGILSDIEFPRDGKPCETAGVDLARTVREVVPDLSIVLHSSRPENARLAQQVGAHFLLKNSPTLLNDLSRLMREDFSFGDFVFRLPDRREVGRASDLRSLERQLALVPAECIAYHGERNHFSKWLRARTEFALAHRLRARRICDYPDLEAIRADLIRSIKEYRLEQRRGVITDFRRRGFDGIAGFERLGGGSLGGKARGLAFVRRLLAGVDLEREFPGTRLGVPPCIVIGTDLFDAFMAQSDLADFAIHCTDDAEIRRRFEKAELPSGLRRDLVAFLKHVKHPLAVRSSSRLEDSQYQPFTGVYRTYLLPNVHRDPKVRLEELERAIKGVYAATFSQHAKAYLRATPYRLEEEKMAVILQRMVGSRHGPRCYPHFAGVARSWNFYPTPPLTSEDGIAAVALGLGRTVVEGGDCLRFCPRYPKHLVQFSAVRDMLKNSQREFWALLLEDAGGAAGEDLERREARFGLDAAEKDGTLAWVGSTYSHENAAVYDGIARAGTRLVSFAPILKHELFPLAPILTRLLEIGSQGMGGPVEIEFAVDLGAAPEDPKELGFLQMRRLAPSRELDELAIGELPSESLLCHSTSVLGHGRLEGIRDLVVVDYHHFDRGRSRDAAQEVAAFNAELAAARRPYVLIGVGRWGASDPWLGIPVTWDQISGARVVVESGFKDFKVTPSQGTHFFQNLTSFEVGYFTVNPELSEGFVDWDWLAAQPVAGRKSLVRHLHLAAPILVIMNGKAREGVIAKPTV